MKSLVCEDTTLRYSNMKKAMRIPVYVYGKGLGATLMQDDGAVAFASKLLRPTEQGYTNNECEILTCKLGVKPLRTNVLGKCFTMESHPK